VVIDEAGMADTLSLDAAVAYLVDRGGSVRLIGDDQQLSAIGAGGVLRDIQASHGAVRLTELLRFTDPAEAAATLALRDGQPEAIGFYLDNQRVHVGDLSTITEQVFTAWQQDRSQGLDSIMLAPTRDLVAELNRRARSHRLADTPPGINLEVTLADGNQASVGELIITRSNDRQLRLTSTDWVKNGDRWTVVAVNVSGDFDVQHCRNRHRVRLPAAYVQSSAELGYATTVHAAQGVSVDTMHGLATGQESRQQLYTMLTRGRITSHLYLQVVGDGDPHSLISPETVRQSTPTDILEQILARDDAARSATTLQHDQHDPAAPLGEATRRYVDALHAAAEDLAAAQGVAALENSAEEALPCLTDEPAWPTLRGRLLLLASGSDPIPQLRTFADVRELESADDQAAVLGWRLDDTGNQNGFEPLSWLPAIPQRLHDHQTWAPYLAARARMVAELANRVRRSVAADRLPIWVGDGLGQPPSRLVEDIEVWRAAMGVSPDDQRPTGPVQRHKTARVWQRQLDKALGGSLSPASQEWGPLIGQIAPTVRNDGFAPILASRLAALSGAGISATQLLRTAITGKPLPDDHSAAALWWRICRHVTPSLSAQINQNATFTRPWDAKLAELVGAERAKALQASEWWPALVEAVDHGLQRGWRLEDLLRPTNSVPHAAAVDQYQAMVWRISVALDPLPDDEPHGPHLSSTPDDLAHANAPAGDENAAGTTFENEPAVASSTEVTVAAGAIDERWLKPDLTVAAMLRDVAGPPEQTDADVSRMFSRAIAWRECPVSRERMIEINHLTLAYFRRHLPTSWGQHYLADRFGEDIANDARFQPGQAPNGWTNLVNHLRQHAVTDDEMIITGVATMASTGRLIDRFRNRVVFPIIHDSEVLGFIGRRHPDLSDIDRAGPKYLNTGETPLFHKGAQLYGVLEDKHSVGAIPVIVEGPMDAIAVTLASRGRYIGVAPLGTSLTEEQASQLARISMHPVGATDADPAGRIAAERAYWMLSCHRLDPLHALLPDGTDPADLLALKGPTALTRALGAAQPLAERLLDERLNNLPPAEALLEAARVVAARPSRHWDQDSSVISLRLGVPMAQVRHTLLTLVKQWNTDPRRAAQQPLQTIGEIKHRISTAAGASPAEQRRTPLAREANTRTPPSNRTSSTPTPAR
jgi:DNA primase catalytic core